MGRKRCFLGFLASLFVFAFSANAQGAAGYTCTKVYDSCKNGFYLSDGNCHDCTGATNSTSTQTCTLTCSVEHADSCTCSNSGSQTCNGKYTAGNGTGGTGGAADQCTGCDSWTPCSGTCNPNVVCSKNYYLDDGACSACTGVPFTDDGTDTTNTGTCPDGTTKANASGTSQPWTRTCYRTGTSDAGATSASQCTGSGNCGTKNYGTCVATGCSDGYHLVDGACVANTFTVTYDGNGNTDGTNPGSHTCTYGDTSCRAKSNTFTKTNYQFNGWTASCSTGCTLGQTDVPAGDDISNITNANGVTITLTAKWTQKSGSGDCDCTEGEGATSCNATANDTQCNYTWSCEDGYWKAQQSATGQGTSYTATCDACPSSYNDGSVSPRNARTTCYAKRTPTCTKNEDTMPNGCTASYNDCQCDGTKYTVYSNSAGTGDGTIDGNTTEQCTKAINLSTLVAQANHYVDDADGISCPLCSTLEPEDYYTHSDGGSDGYSQCYHICTIDDVEHARAVEEGENIYYDAEDATCHATECEGDYYLENGVCVDCPDNAICDGGEDFDCKDGYHKNTAGNGCDPNIIHLTYNNGGHGTAPTTPNQCTYNQTFTLPAAMIASGYTFTNWETNGTVSTLFSGGDSVLCTVDNLGVYANDATATITAKWEAETGAVKLMNNYTSNDSSIFAQVNAEYGALMPSVDTNGNALSSPIRPGYIFTGFYDARTNGTKYYEDDMSSARTWDKTGSQDLYLYAQWDDCPAGSYCDPDGNKKDCSTEIGEGWTSDANSTAKTDCYYNITLDKNGYSGNLSAGKINEQSCAIKSDATGTTNAILQLHWNTACTLPAIDFTKTGWENATKWSKTSAEPAESANIVTQIQATQTTPAVTTYYVVSDTGCAENYGYDDGSCTACDTANGFHSDGGTERCWRECKSGDIDNVETYTSDSKFYQGAEAPSECKVATCKDGYHKDNNKCDPNIIHLTYNDGGHGTAPTTPNQCTYNQTFTLPAAITASGYTFTNWETNGTVSTLFSGGDSVLCTLDNLGVYANDATATITAMWEAETGAVKLMNNYTSNDSSIFAQVNAEYGTLMPSVDTNGNTLSSPKRARYVFTGFYDARTNGNKYYNADMSSANNWDKTGSQNLYAQWDDCPAGSYCDPDGNKYSCTEKINDGHNWTSDKNSDDIHDCYRECTGADIPNATSYLPITAGSRFYYGDDAPSSCIAEECDTAAGYSPNADGTACIKTTYNCPGGVTENGAPCPEGSYCPRGDGMESCVNSCPPDAQGGDTSTDGTGKTSNTDCYTIRSCTPVKQDGSDTVVGYGDSKVYYTGSEYNSTPQITVTSCVDGYWHQFNTDPSCVEVGQAAWSPAPSPMCADENSLGKNLCSDLNGGNSDTTTDSNTSGSPTDCYNTCPEELIKIDGEVIGRKVPAQEKVYYNGTTIPVCNYPDNKIECETGYERSGSTCVPKVYTVTLNHGEKEGNTCADNCTSTPTSPVYLKYNTGWYATRADAVAGTNPITTVTIPVWPGNTFGGYWFGNTEVISASGDFVTTSVITEEITADWSENDRLTCYPGTYYEGTGDTCTDCPAGSYCDKEINVIKDTNVPSGKEYCPAADSSNYTPAQTWNGTTLVDVAPGVNSPTKSKDISACYATVQYSADHGKGSQVCHYNKNDLKYNYDCADETILTCDGGYYRKNTRDTECSITESGGYYSVQYDINRTDCPLRGTESNIETLPETGAISIVQCIQKGRWWTNASGHSAGTHFCYFNTDYPSEGYTANCKSYEIRVCDGGYYVEEEDIGQTFQTMPSCLEVGDGYYSPAQSQCTGETEQPKDIHGCSMHRSACPATSAYAGTVANDIDSTKTNPSTGTRTATAITQCYLNCIVEKTNGTITQTVIDPTVEYNVSQSKYPACEYDSNEISCSDETNGKYPLPTSGATEKTQCYQECNPYDIGDCHLTPVGGSKAYWPDECHYTATIDGNPAELIDGECVVTGCQRGYEMINGECEPCDRENALSYKSGDACAVESCVIGYHPNGDKCDPDILDCTPTVQDASYAEQKWISSIGQYDICIAKSCNEGFHLSSNACVADVQDCEIDHGVGKKTWNPTTNKFGPCIATKCAPGYTSDPYLKNNASQQCSECRNKFSTLGEAAASAYFEGEEDCIIASCIYQGEKYNLDNNECVPICDQPYSDETGSLRWNNSTKKCERTCNPGYMSW